MVSERGYAGFCRWDNLWLAYRLAARGKRRKRSAAAFEHQVADRLVALQDELRGSTYRPGAYRHFYIHEPKRRKISAAPFRDRVVHHALCNLIEPLFERSFIARQLRQPRRQRHAPGAGSAAALGAAAIATCCACDVVQHFPSLDHAILRAKIARVIR